MNKTDLLNSVTTLVIEERSNDPIEIYNMWSIRSGNCISDKNTSIWLLNNIKKLLKCNHENLRLICGIK